MTHAPVFPPVTPLLITVHSTTNMEAEIDDATQDAYPSHLADTSGMAPSVEIRLLQEVRASARAAADASGSGRRARAPSRRLLEASGLIKNEAAQWMTKEIKEADAKLKQKLREQRKQFREVGLKAGVVIEALSVPEAGSGGGVAVGLSDSSGGGEVIGEIDGGGRQPSSTHSWRTLTTAEIIEEARKKRASESTNQHTHDGASLATSEIGDTQSSHLENTGESSKKRKGDLLGNAAGDRKESPVSETDNAVKAKRTRQVEHGKADNSEHEKKAAEDEKTDDKQQARGKEKCEEEGEADGEGEVGSMATCEHGGCQSQAILGASGIGRYW